MQTYKGGTEKKETETTRKENWREKPKVTGITETKEQSELTELVDIEENQHHPKLKIKLKQPTLKELYTKKTQTKPDEKPKHPDNIPETTAMQEHLKMVGPGDSARVEKMKMTDYFERTEMKTVTDETKTTNNNKPSQPKTRNHPKPAQSTKRKKKLKNTRKPSPNYVDFGPNLQKNRNKTRQERKK